MSAAAHPLGPPPRFLSDANFNLHIVAGLRRRAMGIDLLTAQQLGLLKTPDPELLLRARALDRVLLTHDRKTMPAHFADLQQTLPDGAHSPGVMAIEQVLSIGAAIEELLVVWECSTHEEWRDRFVYLPFR